MNEPLRVGVVIPGMRLPRWIVECLIDIQRGDYAEITAILVPDSSNDSVVDCYRGVSAEDSYFDYVTRDHQRHAREPDALAPVDATAILDGIPVVAPLSQSDRKLDLIVVLACVGSAAAFREVTGPEVWAFRYGMAGKPQGYFDEVAGASKAADLALVAVGHNGNCDQVLDRARLLVNDRSLWATRNPILWNARAVLRRNLQRLHRCGTMAFHQQAESRFGLPSAIAPTPKTSAPTGFRMLAFRATLEFRRLLVPYFMIRDQWQIALRRRGADDPAWGSARWCRGFRFLDAPHDRFWADPFLFKRGDETWLFFEDYCWIAGRARISCGRLGPDGALGPVSVALDKPYHLSNPLIFERDGEILMIPETMAQRRVEIYRCRDFPTRWELAATPIQDLDIADPCVIHHDGRWWLFAAVAEFGCLGWEDLHVFWADDLAGPWRPHANNPVVSDVGAARPGGRMFVRDGTLHRLAQDSAGGYGSGLRLWAVEELSPTGYRQREVAALDPFKFGMNGVHAYDFTDEFETVDGRHYQAVLGKWRVKWPFPRWLRKN
jgi:hypothetical protein